MLDFDDYLARLASADPTPGGGSAAALVAAMGAALVAMVNRITLGSPKLASVHERAERLAELADELRERCAHARARDEAAFAAVVAAQALPKDSDDAMAARTTALQAALTEAAEAPLHAATLALEVLELAEETALLGNANLVSDVGCAAAFGTAALRASADNVRVNHLFLKDAATRERQAHHLAALEENAALYGARTTTQVDAVLRGA
jgi:glutamate formiminotransferase/formiminotetrahydrofolate cyclodeaminase